MKTLVELEAALNQARFEYAEAVKEVQKKNGKLEYRQEKLQELYRDGGCWEDGGAQITKARRAINATVRAQKRKLDEVSIKRQYVRVLEAELRSLELTK